MEPETLGDTKSELVKYDHKNGLLPPNVENGIRLIRYALCNSKNSIPY